MTFEYLIYNWIKNLSHKAGLLGLGWPLNGYFCPIHTDTELAEESETSFCRGERVTGCPKVYPCPLIVVGVVLDYRRDAAHQHKPR